MPNLNKVMLIGHLGKDPEYKTLSNGNTVCEFSVAVSEKYKDKETTEWFNVVAFGKIADTLNKWLSKGDSVYIEGKLRTRSWEYEGSKRYRTEVIVTSFNFLTRRENKVANDTSSDVPF